MNTAIIVAAASHNSKRNKSNKKSNILSFVKQYGEICYKCWAYVGDATGHPELCTECKIKENGK